MTDPDVNTPGSTSSPDSPVSPSGIRRATLLTLMIGILVFAGILSVVPNKGRMLRALLAAHWPTMLLALTVLAVAILADTARLWWLCKGIGSPIPFFHVFQGIMAGNFVSLVTPFVSGGAPCIVWVLQQKRIDMSHASAAVIAGGLVSQSTLVLLCIVMPLISGISSASDPFATLLWKATLTIVPLYLTGVVLVAIASYRVDFLQRVLTGWDQSLGDATVGFKPRLRASLRSVIGGLNNYRMSFHTLAMEQPSVLARAFACSVVYFIALFTVGYLVFAALHVRVDYLRVVAAQVVILLAASATPTPGGAGASEFGAYSLFTHIVLKEKVAVFVIIWRLLTYWLLLFLGSIALTFAVRRSTERHDPGASTPSN